jgi:putative modified peptide
MTMATTPSGNFPRAPDAHKLALKLATDDAFRAQFEANPQKVLTESNISIPGLEIPAKVKLPSKAKIIAGIKELTGKDPSKPESFQLEAGTRADAYWAFLAFLAFL